MFGAFVAMAMAQRPSFAGSRPASGYKDAYIQPAQTNSINSGAIGNRITETSTAQIPLINSNANLPIDTRGDAYLYSYYNSLPFDQRPYWFLNNKHLEELRGMPPRRPLPLANRPNQFNGFAFPTHNSGLNSFTQPIANNPNIAPQQPGVVYTSNVTPNQQINTEIQHLQQRLNQLQQQQNNGGQLTQSGRFR